MSKFEVKSIQVLIFSNNANSALIIKGEASKIIFPVAVIALDQLTRGPGIVIDKARPSDFLFFLGAD